MAKIKKIEENLKVADYNDDIATVYDKTRKFIDDKRYLKRFDLIMENIEYEDDAEGFYEDVIEDYVSEQAENKLGPRWGFGVHEISGDIGFWEKDKNGEYTIEYPGMINRFDDEDENEEDEEDEDEEDGNDEDEEEDGDDEDDEEDRDDEDDEEDGDDEDEEDEDEEDGEKNNDENVKDDNTEKIVEVLDKDGQVITTKKYKIA